MNDLYFACRSCQSYVDAGYRWAYWSLEQPGIVTRGTRVGIDDVLGAKEYWKGVVDDQRLADRLGIIHQYLICHRGHDVMFGEDVTFRDLDESGNFLDWLNDDEPGDAELSPRYFVERLRLKRWEDVVAYVGCQPLRPWWWENRGLLEIARAKFNQLVLR